MSVKSKFDPFRQGEDIPSLPHICCLACSWQGPELPGSERDMRALHRAAHDAARSFGASWKQVVDLLAPIGSGKLSIAWRNPLQPSTAIGGQKILKGRNTD